MSQNPDALSKLHNFPQQITPFIGRHQEVTELTQLLANPACRLLTLVGPGGMGKTRLAIAVATAGHIPGDVYFVPLQAVQEGKALLPAIAAALNIPLTGQIPPADQIYQFLQNKEVLLVLDNFEHLLEGVDQISAFLANVPNLKLLITSREVLNLQEEWLFSVHGLSLPASVQADDDLMQYDAVALFAERARRARHNFSLAQEYSGAADICYLVGGMPLALELAAAWTRTMTCQTIAAEIRQSIDFLSTRLRNVSERHRSIQAIFEQTWTMLSAEEQAIYARLSLFRGGFRREAAEQVAGASLNMLAAFVDKSLLHWNPTGRYQMHELLHQFASEELSGLPDVLIKSLHAHCTYYTDFLAQHAPDLYGGKQLETVKAIEADIGNIRAAWEWAVQHKRLADLRQVISPLAYYFQFRGRYPEGMQTLEMALTDSDETDSAAQENRALLLVYLAWFALRLGQVEQAQTLSEQSLAIYEQMGFPLPLPDGHANDPALALGGVAFVRGHYDQAAHFYQQVLQRSQASDTFFSNQQTANYELARIASVQGDYATAQRYAQASFVAAEQAQDHWYMARCHLELGNIAQKLGEEAEARHHFQATYDLREPFGDAVGMAVALSRLGEIALHENDPTPAQDLFDRSITLYRQVHVPSGLVEACLGAGKAALTLRDRHSACNFFAEALATAHEMSNRPLTLAVLMEVGQLLADNGRSDPANTIFATITHHPAMPHDAQTRLPAVEAASEDLETIVALARQELTALSERIGQKTTPSARPLPGTDPEPTTQQANQALVEPLTPRELEVLPLLEAGLTNQAIADQLIITLGTVKAHTNNIYGKLGVNNRTQAVARARQLNLL